MRSPPTGSAPELGNFAMRLPLRHLLRGVGTRHAIADLEEGRPLVYIDYVGYDEVAHRRGPDHPQSFAQLERIDRRIRELLSAARERDVEVMVVSDHGQAGALP
jgi:predicted AlkP superfamily pyrophosphatase or phosphodiesterase